MTEPEDPPATPEPSSPAVPAASATLPQGKQGAANVQGMLRQIQASQSESFQGPIPSPSMLDGYKRINPSLPDRLVTAWEQESAHRQDLERREMRLQEAALEHAKDMDRGEMAMRRSGQNHSTALVFTLLAVGGLLAYLRLTAVAITIFSLTIVGLATIYVLRKRPDSARANNSTPTPQTPPNTTP